MFLNSSVDVLHTNVLQYVCSDLSLLVDGFRSKSCDSTIQGAGLAEDLVVDGETYGCVKCFYRAYLAVTARFRIRKRCNEKNDEDWMKKCMKIRVESRRPVGIPRTWLDSVEADMIELEIDRKYFHKRNKWRKNVMKRKSKTI